MDELQAFRIAVPWALIGGGASFLLVWSLFRLVVVHLTRDHAVACIVTGCAGAIVTRAIGLAWNGETGYWLWFTIGLLVLAILLLVVCATLVVEMWK